MTVTNTDTETVSDTVTDTVSHIITRQKSRKKSLAKFMFKKLSFRKKSQPAVLSEDDLTYISLHTGLERKAVESHYQQFLESHPSGSMEPASLKAMLQESLPGADIAGLAEHIWRIYDTNLDGEVDFREFMLALCVMKTGSPEENLKQIFRLFDINSDGKVERGEMGRVAEELRKLGEVGEELVQSAFIEMDEDMDGGVTEEEFVRACLQQRKASASLTLKVIDIFVSS